MMKRVLFVATASLIAWTVCGTAHAADAFTSQPIGIEAQAGLASPLGFGLGADWSPLSRLSIGVGVGLRPEDGLQLAVNSRVRIVRFDRSAFGLGTGLSTGRWSTDFNLFHASFGATSAKEWARAYWLNGEAFHEHLFANGISLRSTVGMGTILNRDDCRVYGGGACYQPPRFLPYVGLALGYRFSL